MLRLVERPLRVDTDRIGRGSHHVMKIELMNEKTTRPPIHTAHTHTALSHHTALLHHTACTALAEPPPQYGAQTGPHIMSDTKNETPTARPVLKRPREEKAIALRALQETRREAMQRLSTAQRELQKAETAMNGEPPPCPTETNHTNLEVAMTISAIHNERRPVGKMRSVSWVADQITGSPSKASSSRTQERNQRRINALNARDTTIISKYLPAEVTNLFPTLQAPDDYFQPPPWLARTVREINGTDMTVPDAPPFIFEMEEEAQSHNLEKLREFDYDLDALIKHYGSTTIGYGKEF